jgi:hypothetical protein
MYYILFLKISHCDPYPAISHSIANNSSLNHSLFLNECSHRHFPGLDLQHDLVISVVEASSTATCLLRNLFEIKLRILLDNVSKIDFFSVD